MAKTSVGYPLPDGEAYTDELACLMLFYPDKPEYRQALMSAYFYLGTWRAWERESEHKGADAALAWKEAIEVTLGCIQMNVCESILTLLEQIEINTGIYCCETTDISDGDQYTDEVLDGGGSVPQNIIDAGYAEDVDDWDGFDDYKCMISHVMITNMEWQVRKLLTYTDTAGAVAGGVAAVAAIAAVIMTGGAAILVFGIIVGIGLAAGAYVAVAELGEAGLATLADDMATNHDELACAIYNADGSAGAVLALKSKIDDVFTAPQALLLKNLNLPAQLKALYAGRYDQQDIAEAMAENDYDVGDYTCSCELVETETDIWAVSFDLDASHADMNDPISPTHADWRLWIGSQFPGNPQELWNDNEYLNQDALTYTWGGPEISQGVSSQDALLACNDATIDTMTELSYGDWREDQNLMHFKLQKVSSGTTWLGFRFQNFRVFLSSDGGVTGAWVPASLTEWTSGDMGGLLDVDLDDNIVFYSNPGSSGSWTQSVTIRLRALL